MHSHHLILASSSPRRAALLKQIGFTFIVSPSHVEEDLDPNTSPEDHVRILSNRKAALVAEQFQEGIVLGADTIVVVDHEILGKPSSEEHAELMLKKLSGRMHQVLTGITLIDAANGHKQSTHEKTDVWFRTIDTDEMKAYIATGAPMDKAGAYGIQDDYGAVFVEKVYGCFYNVVGLPLSKFYLTYKKFLESTSTDG